MPPSGASYSRSPKKKRPSSRTVANPEAPAQKAAAAPDQALAARRLAFVREANRRFRRQYGEPQTPLRYSQPHELVIAVILSAQCTDEQVNRVTPALFERFKQPAEFYQAPLAELEDLIYSTGFYKNKAKSIRGFTRALVEDLNGVVPDTIDALIRLPGIGRKTANVVLQELYHKSEGVVVDTHVARISRLFQLTRHTDPVKIENDLKGALPRKFWLNWSLYVIFLGRSHCTARVRHCAECYLNDICPASDLTPARPASRTPSKRDS